MSETADLQHAIKKGLEQWEALGAKDSPYGPLLPTKLRRRTAKGTTEDVELLVMVLSHDQRVKARTRARKRAGELELDPSREGPDKDMVLELERLEELALAIRDVEEPHDQKWANAVVLMQEVRIVEPLNELYQLYDDWRRMNDPRFGELSGEDFWKVISEVADRGDCGPLGRIDGVEQIGCIVLMARAALFSPMAPSPFRLRWTSSSAGGSGPTVPEQ